MTSDERTRIYSMNRFSPGVRLNDTYELDERIASGGMGEVYRGHNIETGEPVAIKTVLPELVGDDTVFALFKKEGTILGRLNHPSIVRYYSFSRDPKIGRPYLVMEFVEGQSLADRIKTGPLSLPETRELFAQVADGLALAHKAGVIHRDLSPDNIILQHGEVTQPKIIDFGIARASNVSEHSILGGSFAGKFSFVSPEQLGLLDRQVTNRSDIYSMGLVMAASLRGKPLDMGSLPAEVVEKRRTVPDLGSIDASIRPLLEWMLQPDARDRPHGMLEIADWLKHPPGPDHASARRLPSGAAVAELVQGTGARGRPETEHSSPSAPEPEPPSTQLWPAASAERAPDFIEHVSPVLKGRTVFRARQNKPVPPLAGTAAPTRVRGRSVLPMLVVATAALATGGVYYAGGFDFLRGQVVPPDRGSAPSLAENDRPTSEGGSRPTARQAGSGETDAGSTLAQPKAPVDTGLAENRDAKSTEKANARQEGEVKSPAPVATPKPDPGDTQVQATVPAEQPNASPPVGETLKKAPERSQPDAVESERTDRQSPPTSTDLAGNHVQTADNARGSPSVQTNKEVKSSIPAAAPKPEAGKTEVKETVPTEEPKASPPKTEVAAKAASATAPSDQTETEKAARQDASASADGAEERDSISVTGRTLETARAIPEDEAKRPAPIPAPKPDVAKAEVKETVPALEPKAPVPKAEAIPKMSSEPRQPDESERSDRKDVPAATGPAENRDSVQAANSAQPQEEVKSSAPAATPKPDVDKAKVKEAAPAAEPKGQPPEAEVASKPTTIARPPEVVSGENAETGARGASTASPAPSEASKPAAKSGNETVADNTGKQQQSVALNDQTTDLPAKGGGGGIVNTEPGIPPFPRENPRQVPKSGGEAGAGKTVTPEQTVALNAQPTDLKPPAADSESEAVPPPNPEDCFFAAIANQSDEAMTIKGIGLSMAPFERIKSALASSDSGEARIDGHIITASQCPAAAFIKEVYGATTDNPKLNFTSAGMVSGDAVAGTVGNVHSRRVRLFMVDGKGVVYDLQDNLAIANSPPLFRLTFGPARANFAPPGVIVALTSDQPIDLGPPFGAASSLAALAKTLVDRGDVSGIDFAFFPYRSLGSASSP